ncbi:DUF4037 domain-containing protein [Actinoplanes friuliensis]|uniref:DUF4037 domain-containing protein n=1 Tax=Actinoplanes friuliensis DSM 7358 TaxID=1246995 RepID=U5W1U7_9ACTN|nr:DUF4037 domain-containing protein [Actinoplanes friuliensis]AGZ43198.1 hypothetical protein AFR_24660 [Actinoplanes friuliensis DSM 7358]
MHGIALSRRLYEEAVRPSLGGRPHAAALLGAGSEVLGFDDEVSTDHDFDPRVQIFLPRGVDPPAPAPPGAEFTSVRAFFGERLGFDPAAGMRPADWLLTPTQVLATLTAGAVFHDPVGEVARYQSLLRWYPDDVWRYALAASWLKVAQEEAFPERTGGVGDDLGSRLVTARLTRELVRLAFLIERRWAPYTKWLGSAFARLDLAAPVGPLLTAALSAPGWREREDALVRAASLLAAATNDLNLAEPIDPSPRQYYTRDVRVIGADRLVVALTTAITDPDLRALLDRLGGRRDGPIGRLPGTIDQAVDSTDILGDPPRCHAAAPMLGLTADSARHPAQ